MLGVERQGRYSTHYSCKVSVCSNRYSAIIIVGGVNAYSPNPPPRHVAADLTVNITALPIYGGFASIAVASKVVADRVQQSADPRIRTVACFVHG
jgi:hypothetical protein